MTEQIAQMQGTHGLADRPLVSVRGASKRFGATQALRGVDLDVLPGSVLALLGQNGAGKSTLIKVLAGCIRWTAVRSRSLGIRWAACRRSVESRSSTRTWGWSPACRWPRTSRWAPDIPVGADSSAGSRRGATVVGVRRSTSGDLPEGVSQIVGLDALHSVLPTADVVVLTLPGTPHTRSLINAERLALLPPHAVLVNVGRGSVVDSGALAAALDGKALRGAVLDVTDAEPLPPDSTLWGRANVIISPHTAALTRNEDDRITALFADNLTRLLTDQPLRNTVNLTAGY